MGPGARVSKFNGIILVTPDNQGKVETVSILTLVHFRYHKQGHREGAGVYRNGEGDKLLMGSRV